MSCHLSVWEEGKSGTKQYKAVIVLIICNSPKDEKQCNVCTNGMEMKAWMSEHDNTMRAGQRRAWLYKQCCFRTDNSWDNGIIQINLIKCSHSSDVLYTAFSPACICENFPSKMRSWRKKPAKHRTEHHYYSTQVQRIHEHTPHRSAEKKLSFLWQC